jgi:hypothetical protein
VRTKEDIPSRLIDQLKPILNSGDVFRTVLTDNDLNKLLSITESIQASILKNMEATNFQEAKSSLACLECLSVVDHPAVERHLAAVTYQMGCHFKQIVSEFEAICNNLLDDHHGGGGGGGNSDDNTATLSLKKKEEEAERLLSLLEAGFEFFGGEMDEVIKIEQRRGTLVNVKDQTLLKLKENRKFQQDKAAALQLQDAEEKIQSLMQLLQKQQAQTDLQLKEQEMRNEKIRSDMLSSMESSKDSHARLEASLRLEMESRLASKEQEFAALNHQQQQGQNNSLELEKQRIADEYAVKLKQAEEDKIQLLKQQQEIEEKRVEEMLRLKEEAYNKLKEIEAKVFLTNDPPPSYFPHKKHMCIYLQF